ncbi:MAG: AAA family ATPase [Desulfobacterales bacterium]
MGFHIAMAGKGGTGKTTLAGLLVRYLISHGRKPVLAVDADSNANLNEVLGVPLAETVGEAREDMKRGQVPSGMTKDLFLEMKLGQAVVEAGDFDLIAMGRPEGPGCYCAANSILVTCLEKLVANYPWVVMDNEAGMEHISRLTTKNVDVLIIVSDASRRGLEAALRIERLARELNIGVGASHLIVNRASAPPAPEALRPLLEAGLPLAGIVPEDRRVYEFDAAGRPIIELPEDSECLRAAYGIFARILP